MHRPAPISKPDSRLGRAFRRSRRCLRLSVTHERDDIFIGASDKVVRSGKKWIDSPMCANHNQGMEHTQPYTTPQSVSRAVELAQGVASLELLYKVDRTVDALVADARNFGAATCRLHDIAEEIKETPVTKGVFLDPDDCVTNILGKAGENLKNYLPYIILKHSAINKDDNLSTNHKESLHDAYEEWIVAASSLLEAFEQVRNSIISHDLDAEVWENYPCFDNAEDLIADLRR